MLGLFFQKLAENCVHPVEVGELQSGDVVVGATQLENLRAKGLPGILRFGIADGEGNVICQTSSGAAPESVIFSIRKLSIPEFLSRGTRAYTFDVETQASRQITYERARQRLGENDKKLRSFPGDDFVAECLFGMSMETLMGTKWLYAGRHWSTVFCPDLEDFLEALGLNRDDCVGIKQSIPDWVAPHLLPDQTHHGIVIEGDRVIHFSACHLDDHTSRIKTDSLDDFLHWKSDRGEGSALAYSDESTGVRLLTRNRAIWILFHSWDPYNLLTNNCEHFCRYCRTGEKESRQVTGRMVEIVGTIMENLPNRYARLFGRILSQTGGVINQPTNTPRALADLMHLSTLKTTQNRQLL